MMSEFFKKYLTTSKEPQKKENSSIEKLEQLTYSLMAEYEPPDYTVMELVLELNDNGVIGLDHHGNVIFYNSYASDIIKKKNIKGKNFSDIIDARNSEKLRSFMNSDESKICLKVEIEESELVDFFDVAVFKIANGKTFYVMFFVNCLEKAMFSLDKCPLKNDCPFNQKCQRELSTIGSL
jgi:c-di-AMP phosphodiesterase-like protein